MSSEDDTARQARRSAMSISDFCKTHGLSKPQYFVLRKQGRGPDELRFGGQLVLISVEAAARWRKKYTVKTGTIQRQHEDTAA